MTRNAILTTTTTTPIEQLSTINLQSSLPTQLPCLQHILSFLSRPELKNIALVCKAWQEESAERLWSTFKFSREKDFDRIFHVLSQNYTTIRYGHYIKSLELVHSDKDFNINSSHIFLITLLCPNLLSFSATFHHTRIVSPPAATYLIENRKSSAQQPLNQSNPQLPIQFPSQLESQRALPLLALARQHHQQQKQQHNHTQQLSQHNPLPQHHQPRHTQSLPLAHLAHNCTKLKSIRLVSYSPKTDDSIYEMTKYLTSGCLESISFDNCSTIQSSTLCKLAITNPQLKCIEITGNTPVTDSSLTTLADRCGDSLEDLSIGNACLLTDKSMRHVAWKCKKIRNICIFNNNTENISEDTLTALITQCPSLQMLSLNDAKGLGDVFFKSVLKRVNNEMLNICENRAKVGTGLQRLCLGGVRRQMIQSKLVEELIDKSVNKHNLSAHDEQNNEQDHNVGVGMSNKITYFVDSNKFMPKSTVIRGNTIWWQRRPCK